MSTAMRLSDLANIPDAFLYRLDISGQRALIARLPTMELRSAAFLDERLLDPQRHQGIWMPLQALLQRVDSQERLPNAIFHIGHCGSTLLSRMLDALPGVLGLREPLVLRTLAPLYEELGSATARLSVEQWQCLFGNCLNLLSRRAAADGCVLIKATSGCNSLIEPWIRRDRQARAILMYIDLRSYLRAILKSPGSRNDCESFVAGRLAYLHTSLGDRSLRLYQLDQAQRIALGWVAELRRFQVLLESHNKQLKMLNFSSLLVDPQRCLPELAEHLGIHANAQSVAMAMRPEVMGRYSKATDHRYSTADRLADLAAAQQLFGAEIEQGMDFVTELLGRHEQLRSLRPLLSVD